MHDLKRVVAVVERPREFLDKARPPLSHIRLFATTYCSMSLSSDPLGAYSMRMHAVVLSEPGLVKHDNVRMRAGLLHDLDLGENRAHAGLVREFDRDLLEAEHVSATVLECLRLSELPAAERVDVGQALAGRSGVRARHVVV